jgi:hypothetical protein
MIEDRRADPRLLMHTQVEVTGVDRDGLQFMERTSLEDVGDCGCRFSLRNAVPRGAILGVQPLGRDGEEFPDEYPRLFAVIWVKWRGGRWTLGTRNLLEAELSNARGASGDRPSKIPTR